MPVKATKSLKAVKKTTVISTYVSGTPLVPASGHLCTYVDLPAADQHREVEVLEQLQKLIDRAREENYNRAVGSDTVYYIMGIDDNLLDIRKSTTPLTRAISYEPVDGTVIDFVIGDLTYEPADGTVINFVDGGAGDDTITDDDEGFIAAGFEAGQDVIITGSTSNDSTVTLTEVTAGTLTMATGSLAATEEGINGVLFTVNLPDSITDDTGSFLDEGFLAGQDIVVADTTSNDGTYTAVSVAAGTITLAVDELATTEEGIDGLSLSTTIGAIAEGDVAIGIDTGVVSGNNGSTILDVCWTQIREWAHELDRLTA